MVYADAVSQNCSIKPKTYAMTQGPKIKSMAKKALKLDPAYGAAKYLENSQNIFTPEPFCDIDEGMRNLDLLLDTDQFRMDNFDRYSALSARAYGYLQRGMKEEARSGMARPWKSIPEMWRCWRFFPPSNSFEQGGHLW